MCYASFPPFTYFDARLSVVLLKVGFSNNFFVCNLFDLVWLVCGLSMCFLWHNNDLQWLFLHANDYCYNVDGYNLSVALPGVPTFFSLVLCARLLCIFFTR